MAKAKKTALNISTGKDKSTKAQRKRAYTVAVLITAMIVTVGLMVACDSATPSVSSVQGSNPSVYNWKEKVANTEWNYEEGKDSFSGVTDEQLLALLDCDHMKIKSDLKLTFSGGFFGGVTSLASLVFDEISDGGGSSVTALFRLQA